MWGAAMTKRGHQKRAHAVNGRLPGLHRKQEDTTADVGSNGFAIDFAML
jgi:hypothetical protein